MNFFCSSLYKNILIISKPERMTTIRKLNICTKDNIKVSLVHLSSIYKYIMLHNVQKYKWFILFAPKSVSIITLQSQTTVPAKCHAAHP